MIARRYGASPLHAIAHVIALAAMGWAVLQLVDARDAFGILIWFVGAVILHDLLLLPFYSGLDRAASKLPAGGAVNYLRVPAALTGLLFLVYFPLILGLERADSNYRRVSGIPYDGYLSRFLLVTAALFAASALLYLVRGRRRQRSAGSIS